MPRARTPRRSAGVLLYRIHHGAPQVLIGHMGGPFWVRKDAYAWSIPKGGYDDDEDPLAAACREFTEEVGAPVPADSFIALGEITQRTGKVVTAWAAEGDLDPTTAVSNLFDLEWPPGSGQIQQFPEFDRVAWFAVNDARERLLEGQEPLLDRLLAVLNGG